MISIALPSSFATVSICSPSLAADHNGSLFNTVVILLLNQQQTWLSKL
jgi:hypothetical protein